MRVLHVAEVAHGGVLSLVRTFAELQARAGFEVHLLLPPGVDGVDRTCGVDVTVHRWAPRRAHPQTFPHAIRQLSEVVATARPDVVHLHSFFPGLLGRFHHMPLELPVVYQPHSWAFQAAPTELGARAVAKWEQLAISHTDVVVTNCRGELAEGRRRHVTRGGEVIGLPLDTRRFSPVDEDERAKIRADLGLSDARVLVCVGRLSAQKGQDALARAWETALLPGTVLVIVGPGDPSGLRAAAPSTYGRSLRWVGPCQDVRPWLRAADVAVQPSRYEGQSVAMAEAMACGRPVVMTDVNGAREALHDPEGTPAGVVVPVGDMTGLLRSCAVLLRDPQHLAATGRAARTRAVALFDQDVVVSRLTAIYEKAAERALLPA